jgi:hypothetical protein
VKATGVPMELDCKTKKYQREWNAGFERGFRRMNQIV